MLKQLNVITASLGSTELAANVLRPDAFGTTPGGSLHMQDVKVFTSSKVVQQYVQFFNLEQQQLSMQNDDKQIIYYTVWDFHNCFKCPLMRKPMPAQCTRSSQ